MLILMTVDFPKGIDGPTGVYRNLTQVDPFLGDLLVFRNMRSEALDND